MTGFDWFVAIFCSLFAVLVLIGAVGMLKDYKGWIAKVFGVAYIGIAVGLFVVGFAARGDADWADKWWTRLIMVAALGFAIWAELEKRGKVTYLGLTKNQGGEQPRG